MEDNLKWKMIFDGRQPSILDDLQREETEVLNKGLPKLEFDTKDHVLLFCQTPVIGQVFSSRLRLGVDFTFDW